MKVVRLTMILTAPWQGRAHRRQPAAAVAVHRHTQHHPQLHCATESSLTSLRVKNLQFRRLRRITARTSTPTTLKSEGRLLRRRATLDLIILAPTLSTVTWSSISGMERNVETHRVKLMSLSQLDPRCNSYLRRKRVCASINSLSSFLRANAVSP